MRYSKYYRHKLIVGTTLSCKDKLNKQQTYIEIINDKKEMKEYFHLLAKLKFQQQQDAAESSGGSW